MIKKYKFKNIKEYLLTIIVCSIIVIALCFCIQLDLLFRTENRVNTEELKLENLAKFCTIDQLEKRLAAEPSNYAISIRLGMLYESLEKYQKANEYYQNALKLSGRSNYAIYSYALFCAKRNLIGFATGLCEELQGNTRKVYQYKALIYEAIGDSLTANKEYVAAVKAYQVSYKYAKNIKDRKKYNEIRTKFAHAYTDSADFYMNKSMVDNAILELKNSLKVKNNALANYKLGLIYNDIDKVRAEAHINNAFKINPYIVNPYIYNLLLNDLIAAAKASNDGNALNLYTVRLTNFKKELSRSYIYKNDVIVSNAHILTVKKKFSDSNHYYLVFDLKNNTKEIITQLFLEAELFVNSKRYVLNQKVISNTNPLAFYDEMPNIRIPMPNDMKLTNIKDQNDIIVKFYARKMKKAPWTLVKIDFLNF